MPASTTIDGVDIERLGHSAFQIGGSEGRVYIDVFSEVISTDKHRGDVLLSTHAHWDHYDPETLNELSSTDTSAVVHESCNTDKLDSDNVHRVSANEQLSVGNIDIQTVPAHNLVRMREPGEPYHPKGEGLGYVCTIDDVTIYHAGDTDPLEEMVNIDADVMLVPIGGSYVMSLQDAYWALHMVQPEVVIPMHYGHIDASKADASGFESLIEELNEDIGAIIEGRIL
jgi:L-ascorbate metabolism protein UlaG (beta-lactamase superfamily)